jgi:ABC-2 type transport system ATP-binding protein
MSEAKEQPAGGPASAGKAAPPAGATAGEPTTSAATGASAPPSAALFELQDVSVNFAERRGGGDAPALAGIDLTIRSGDLAVILGPDGAGKSTLLRVLVGLQVVHAGRRRSTVEVARLGYAGASFDLYGDLTVAENLLFFARLRGLTPEEAHHGLERMLALTDLTEARARPADRLSGGMKKKLALAVALVHHPSAVLLDEPTVGVDPVSRRELWDILAEANAWGTAVVYTSPYLDEAARARRVLLLRQGVLRELDAGELLARVSRWRCWLAPLPDDRRLLRGRLASLGLGPRVYLRPEGLAVLATEETQAQALAQAVLGHEVTLDVRPLSLDDAFVLLEEASR